MKKFLAIAFVLCFVMLTSYAHATLIGVQGGPRPDILINTSARVDYTESTDLFVFTGDDLKITYADTTKDYLSGTGFTTKFTLSGYVDAFGNWTGGITGYDMVEIVTEGTVTIKGVTYGFGTVLLAGEVKAFGWANFGTPSVPKFDFLIDKATLSGLLTTLSAPPDLPWSTAYDTGVISTGESGQIIDWSDDFSLTEMKGDKFPLVPEPGTLLLLGSGLLGLAGYSRFRLHRKKK